jgi:hypothetical protein
MESDFLVQRNMKNAASRNKLWTISGYMSPNGDMASRRIATAQAANFAAANARAAMTRPDFRRCRSPAAIMQKIRMAEAYRQPESRLAWLTKYCDALHSIMREHSNAHGLESKY